MTIVANFALLASRRTIFDLPVCDLDWESALSFTDELAALPVGQTVISFVNAHNANLMVKQADYQNVLQNQFVLPDGIGMDIASWFLHGERFPANLNGTDFVPALMTYMARPKRIGLIGATTPVVQKAAERFAQQCPWHTFVAISDGYLDHEGSLEVVKRIEELQLDVLLVCMGTPRQEKWVAEYIKPEHARVVLTGGALFDFVSGTVPRAPHLIRKLRLEWVYRLWQEPQRLARRYIFGIPEFFVILMRFWMVRGRGLTPQTPSPRNDDLPSSQKGSGVTGKSAASTRRYGTR